MHRSSLYTADATVVYTGGVDSFTLLASPPHLVGMVLEDLSELSISPLLVRNEGIRRVLP